MDGSRSRFGRALAILAILLHCTVAKETEVRAHAGTNVTLPCRVDINQCGTLHSVKWYRDTSRIYVFSQAGKVARAEGDATERMTVEYNESGNETLLKISPVEVEDEATYKCEITYLEVRENCDVVQIVKLTTLVKPVSVRILGNDGMSISNSTKLKPKNEGEEIEVICEAIGGKPIPTVTWYNGTTVMKRASYSAHGDGNGVGTGVSKLQLTLSRGDLNARFECKVDSDALGDEPIISWITVDVNVRPTRMELTGVSGHVRQGEKVYLTCDVYGARPAAKVRWYNGSQPIDEKDLIQTIPEDSRDGTFVTKSELIFSASRWENGRSFNCYAENEVTKSMLEPALHKLVFLDVRFPPVIKVSALKTVVREREKIMLSCTYYANPQKLLDATWLKDGKNFTRIYGKHEHGNTTTPSLHISSISRDDMGVYTCWLKNEIGAKESEESIFLDVQYPPDVEVIMEPSTPVKALERGNVTLECNVTSGNPPLLRKVRWFLGGDLMTELPECNYTQPAMNETLGGGPFCGIDPSILSLIKVEESFAGNYTCQGENDAGYGPESEPQELIVYYPPTPAKLRYYPSTVIKKGSVTLECTVDHPGRPDNVTYIWYRGSYEIHNITVSNWTIQQASLETRSNFTCIALNEGGQSAPATVAIDVLAPPAFINTLVSYKGVLFSSKNVSLTCQVECSPLCSIIWYKDGSLLNTHQNPLYYVNNTIHPADNNKNDFESIESTLIWNMTNWPGQELNKSALHSHYTCASISTRDVGTHVNFTTEIAIDFPPEELTLSKQLVNVVENEVPDFVKCSGKGRPKLSYLWRKDSTSEPLVKDDTLKLDKMSRSAAGTYICEASNKYGKKTAATYINVQYKPDCSIETAEREGSPALVCIAKANPNNNITFTWKIRESNDTIEHESIFNEGLNSYLILDSSMDTYRTYQCVAKNSVGESIPCERYVSGVLPWYKRMTQENLIIVVASIIALIICVIIVCIVIIILCRRKRENTKSPNPSSTGDKMRLGAAPPVGGSADPANDPDKGFYENLPFHGMQNPPNKPISVIAPFTQATTHNFPPTKLLPHNPSIIFPSYNNKVIQRHQSFHGFQNNQYNVGLLGSGSHLSNPYINTFGSQNFFNPNWSNWLGFDSRSFCHQTQKFVQPPAYRFSQSQSNFQPLLNFNPLLYPNPFSVPPQPNRVIGRRETDIRRTASGIHINKEELKLKKKEELNKTFPLITKSKCIDETKRFGSLELKKHKCYSPTFYSMRCKKHAKKRPVIYALPKKFFSDNKSSGGNQEVYQELTDSIQIFEQDSENLDKNIPVPAPRCKKHRKTEIIYENVSHHVTSKEDEAKMDTSNSSNEDSEIMESQVSVIEAQIHTSEINQKEITNTNMNKSSLPSACKTEDEIRSAFTPKLVGVSPKVQPDSSLIKAEALKTVKNSPILKVSPNFVKPKTESAKGALSLQIQAKRKNSTDNLSQSNDNLKENFPLIPQMPLINPQTKWNPGLSNANAQNAFYTLTTPHYKHLNVGLPPQYSATIPKHTKLIPRALFNEQLPKSKSFSSKSKHKKHFQIPLQKCHSFKFQTAESYFQPIKNIHEEDLMKNGYVSDYPENSRRQHKREKPKQKTKGPLVLRRPSDYHENMQFQENMHNSVQLQYPQPIVGRSLHSKPNGVVYADLDMPKATNKKSSHQPSPTQQGKSQKSKAKTEYATLTFNDVGQEIDV